MIAGKNNTFVKTWKKDIPQLKQYKNRIKRQIKPIALKVTHVCNV